jgi:hypothetical protein
MAFRKLEDSIGWTEIKLDWERCVPVDESSSLVDCLSRQGVLILAVRCLSYRIGKLITESLDSGSLTPQSLHAVKVDSLNVKVCHARKTSDSEVDGAGDTIADECTHNRVGVVTCGYIKHGRPG